MTLIKIAHGTKLKDLPLEQRVVLRLITLVEQQKKTAELRTIAKETSSTFMEVMKSVEVLATNRTITFKPITANEFEFTVDSTTRGALQLPASCYNKHLKAKAEKAARCPVRVPRSPPPAHLPPITDEQRVPWTEKGAEMAKKIGAPKVAKKVANCFARIGEEEVNKIYEAVDLGFKSGPQPPPMSKVKLFFTLYTARRDSLITA